MAFDLNTVSPEMKKSPEIPQTTENREAGLEVPQGEQAQVAVEYTPAVEVQPQPIEVPQNFEQPVSVQKDELLAQVEAILADKTIMKIYPQLPEDKKIKFKEAGEKLAREVRDGIRTKQLRPYRVLNGVTSWLSMIPNVDRYFLRQEAKLDVDQILSLAEEQSSPNAM